MHGFDSNVVNDKNTLGIAYSHLNSDFKFKDKGKNDSAKSSGHVVSVYGKHSLNDMFSINGIYSYDYTKLDTNLLRSITNDKNIYAKGKLKYRSHNLDLNLNYHTKLSKDIKLNPYIGFSASKNIYNDYKESGAGLKNLTISHKNKNSLSGSVGVNLEKQFSLANGLNLTPSVSLGVEKVLNKPSQRYKAKLNSLNYDLAIDSGSTKKAAIKYNTGASLSITDKNNPYEIKINYSNQAMKKYISHQGSLQVRINL